MALDRTSEAAERAGVSVTWLHSGLLQADLTANSFDLVSAQCPALRPSPDRQA